MTIADELTGVIAKLDDYCEERALEPGLTAYIRSVRYAMDGLRELLAAREVPIPVARTAPAAPDPAAKRVSIRDVQLAAVQAQRDCAPAAVQKVVMDHGGVKKGRPSLKTVPREQYAACIAAMKALPRTKS